MKARAERATHRFVRLGAPHLVDTTAWCYPSGPSSNQQKNKISRTTRYPNRSRQKPTGCRGRRAAGRRAESRFERQNRANTLEIKRGGVFFGYCPPTSSAGFCRLRAVSVVSETTHWKPACEVELTAPSTESPRTGSLGLVVPEISGFNQISYEFGDGLSRELLALGGPSLGSLGRARGELSGGVGRYCTETTVKCGHCGGPHRQDECEEKQKGIIPVCVNCKNEKHGDTGHNAFSAICPIRRKWDSIARARVAYH
ncbi:hypothetical protein ACJJTC_004985 [Scirpophaga incertulas]